MNIKNNKGFTLIELLVTVIILALVTGIGAYSITKILETSKEKDYELLIENIKSAVEEYYIECSYSKTDAISCPTAIPSTKKYKIKLQDLVTNGFLKGNSTIESNDSNNGKFTLVNPKDNELISDCMIRYYYSDEAGKIKIEADNATGSCPTDY